MRVDGGCMKSRLNIVRANAPLHLAVCALCFAGIGLFAQAATAPVEGMVFGGAGAAAPEASLLVEGLNTMPTNIAPHQFSRMRHRKVPGRNV